MLYGTAFMMCGAYTLSQDGHVRGDFFYGSAKPRTQATLDFVLYLLFFMPGVIALTWAGWTYAGDAISIREMTNSADAIPLYPFKAIIPLTGFFVLMQGLAEILRCAVCLQTGEWPARLKDANEIDVVEQQLSASVYVDEEAKREAIERAKNIDEEAHQRGSSMGEKK
jgi:TRAP-type mannitol/chloroaromatic compound transport system permease small subunit